MATNWDEVVKAIHSLLKSNIKYADSVLIGGLDEYLAGNVGQAINRDFLILLSHPNGDSQTSQSLLGRLHMKTYYLVIAIVAKTESTTPGRMFGVGKKSLFEVQGDIYNLLEHSNLGGLVENKAGTNFETGWLQHPIESKAFTVYSTLYSATKIE